MDAGARTIAGVLTEYLISGFGAQLVEAMKP